MRDPDRIPKIIYGLSELWKRYPDMRFCQLMQAILPRDRDCFYMEDEEFEKLLTDGKRLESPDVPDHIGGANKKDPETT